MKLQQNPAENQIIFDVTHAVISKVAPEELIYLPSLIEAGLSLGDDQSSSSDQEPLAFGVPGEVIAMAPVVASMVVAALTFLSTEVVKAAKESVGSAIEDRFKTFFQHADKASPPSGKTSPLSVQQLEELKNAVRRAAKRQGVKPEIYEPLADSTIASLVLRLGTPR